MIRYLLLFGTAILIGCQQPAPQQNRASGDLDSPSEIPDSFPVIQLTSGPKQHWFGYYDKWQMDPSGRYILACQVDHFFRSPTPQDTLWIGLIDLESDREWQQIGFSTAWGWQQSCMLQWIPGSSHQIIWNTHSDDGSGFISKIYDTRTQETRTLPRPIYTLSPNGSFALSVDFDRLQFFRPGYGYPAKAPDGNWAKAPEDRGIYKMGLTTGASQLIVSYAQIAQLERRKGSVADNFHWFNHLLINPSGTRFIFLNRSRPVASYEEMSRFLQENPNYQKGKFSGHYVTRALTANVDGTNVFALNDSGQFSHFIWHGDDVVCAWAVPDDGGPTWFLRFCRPDQAIHCSGQRGDDPQRSQYVCSQHQLRMDFERYLSRRNGAVTGVVFVPCPYRSQSHPGQFHEPVEYRGEWRCDLHPRSSQDGKFVIFDSTHGGTGRQVYMIDVSAVVETGI